jgi:hypothetical protein
LFSAHLPCASRQSQSCYPVDHLAFSEPPKIIREPNRTCQ